MSSNLACVDGEGNGKSPHKVYSSRKNSEPCLKFLLRSKLSIRRSCLAVSFTSRIYESKNANLLFIDSAKAFSRRGQKSRKDTENNLSKDSQYNGAINATLIKFHFLQAVSLILTKVCWITDPAEPYRD